MEFLYHVRSDADLKLFYFVLMASYCIVHLIWESNKRGLNLADWGGKLNMVANAATLTTTAGLTRSITASSFLNSRRSSWWNSNADWSRAA